MGQCSALLITVVRDCDDSVGDFTPRVYLANPLSSCQEIDPPTFTAYSSQLYVTDLHCGIHTFYNQVSIGDVGYVNSEGFFYRMFNVTLPSDHPSNNKIGQADPYEPLDCGEFDSSHEKPFHKGDYYTPNVSSERNIENTFARDPRE